MNITFLIGNGFDRNLGLKTAYSDFVEVYKQTPAKNDILKKFREDINANKELWSSAEEEIGRYTSEFGLGQGELFNQCHQDFCEELAKYLKDESLEIKYQYADRDIASAFSEMNSITNAFPTQERALLNEQYAIRRGESIIFNFVIFNYTYTVDKCLSIIKNNQEVLGKHQYNAKIYNHKIGEICHIHGTVDRQMVFGVNDKSQISKPDVFECEYGDLFEDFLIKRKTNQGYQENTDEKAKKIVENSHIIYIYGMSIGATDALWWNRICSWLNGADGRQVILHQHSMPNRGLTEVPYKIEERKIRKRMTSFSSLSDVQKEKIEPRIHITDNNLFASINNIVLKDEKEQKELQQKYAALNEAFESISKEEHFRELAGLASK